MLHCHVFCWVAFFWYEFYSIYFLRSDTMWYTTGKISVYQAIAALILTLWIIQVATGLVLITLIAYVFDISWDHLMFISRSNRYIWLTRSIHMVNPNIIMLLLALHVIKGVSVRVLSVSKLMLWVLSSTLLILTLGLCFTGYVLVSGQMSYWALIVILNLCTVIPIIGTYVLDTALAGTYPNTFSVNRLTVIHYLLGLVCTALVLIHIILIHRASPAYSSHVVQDKVTSLLTVLTKDSLMIFTIVASIFLIPMWVFIHPDNWMVYSTVVTPAHIEPEFYFLPVYSLLRNNSITIGWSNVSTTVHMPMTMTVTLVASSYLAINVTSLFSIILSSSGLFIRSRHLLSLEPPSFTLFFRHFKGTCSLLPISLFFLLWAHNQALRCAGKTHELFENFAINIFVF